MLRQDHKTVKQLFQKIDKLGDRATVQLEQLAREVVTELSKHSAIEEQLFYPAVREYVKDANDMVLESLEEHHIVKWVLSEIDRMQPSDERFRAKLTVLKENVLHHAEEEEQELFPKVRDALGRTALRELGEQMEQLKQRAPTHPHPRSPDSPPLNVLTGALASMTDRVRDRGEAAVRGAATATRSRTRSTARSGKKQSAPRR